MIKVSAKLRAQDSFGDGGFNAPRGSHRHRGIDFCINVHALSRGVVTKIGYPYADDLSFRYVEVTDKDDFKVRYFYIEPSVKLNDKVEPGAILGVMQDLGCRYPRITPHYHFEVMNKDRKIINPHDYLESL